MSQGGTQPLFMIPQIVNPGSNFLPLVHNIAEVSAGFISHFPVIGQADKAPAHKINSKNKVSLAVFEGTNVIPERQLANWRRPRKRICAILCVLCIQKYYCMQWLTGAYGYHGGALRLSSCVFCQHMDRK